jgi:hypothetical protein
MAAWVPVRGRSEAGHLRPGLTRRASRHGRWFKISVDPFDAIHYAGLAIYKIGILLLNPVPLIALYLTS